MWTGTCTSTILSTVRVSLVIARVAQVPATHRAAVAVAEPHEVLVALAEPVLEQHLVAVEALHQVLAGVAAAPRLAGVSTSALALGLALAHDVWGPTRCARPCEQHCLS